MKTRLLLKDPRKRWLASQACSILIEETIAIPRNCQQAMTVPVMPIGVEHDCLSIRESRQP